jgi:hypothetical protein
MQALPPVRWSSAVVGRRWEADVRLLLGPVDPPRLAARLARVGPGRLPFVARDDRSVQVRGRPPARALGLRRRQRRTKSARRSLDRPPPSGHVTAEQVRLRRLALRSAQPVIEGVRVLLRPRPRGQVTAQQLREPRTVPERLEIVDMVPARGQERAGVLRPPARRCERRCAGPCGPVDPAAPPGPRGWSGTPRRPWAARRNPRSPTPPRVLPPRTAGHPFVAPASCAHPRFTSQARTPADTCDAESCQLSPHPPDHGPCLPCCPPIAGGQGRLWSGGALGYTAWDDRGAGMYGQQALWVGVLRECTPCAWSRSAWWRWY